MSLSETIFSYDSAGGQSAIRTITKEDKLYFSLFDVVKTISAENRALDTNRPRKSLLALIKAHATHLLPSEIMTRDKLPKNLDEPLREAYVTKAGLLRVVLQDNSPACIKFQEWVLEEVLPSVLETGSYTHPSLRRDNNTSMSDGNFDVEQMLMLQLQETRERKQADLALKSEMNQLAVEVDNLKTGIHHRGFLLVSQHTDAQEFCDEKLTELFLYCIYLCSTHSLTYKSERLNDKTDRTSKAFSLNTIEAALEKLIIVKT
jgi:prophage antirepressor-like protein